MPPIRPLSLATGIACIAATLVVLAGCGSSGAGSDTGTTARGVGSYLLYEAPTGPGIRPFPYSTDMAVNPLTYGELSAGTLSVPHGVGTVWATAVWETVNRFVHVSSRPSRTLKCFPRISRAPESNSTAIRSGPF